MDAVTVVVMPACCCTGSGSAEFFLGARPCVVSSAEKAIPYPATDFDKT